MSLEQIIEKSTFFSRLEYLHAEIKHEDVSLLAKQIMESIIARFADKYSISQEELKERIDPENTVNYFSQ
jgi:hypothetical protein